MVSSAFGVGGAVMSQPAIRALGVPALIAVGTSLPSIIPGSATGTWRYVRARLIDTRVVRWTAPAGIAASVGGSLLSRHVPGEGHVLMLGTCALLAFTVWRMVRGAGGSDDGDGETEPRVEDASLSDASATHPAWKLIAIGATAGGLSGLLGVGGGVLMVPAFIELLGMRLKSAIATSLACVGLFAVPGTITHAALREIDWRVALLLAAGIVPGARLGSAIVLKARERRLRLAVASFLSIVTVLYGAGEVIALAG